MRARDNPFRTSRVLAVRYRLRSGTWEDLMARLAGLDRRAGIAGPEGSGKSTLLEDLGDRLSREGFAPHWVRLTMEEPRLPRGFRSARFAPEDVLLVDGADLLGRSEWRLVRRRTERAGGLIVTTHRAGLMPTLIRCETTPELLEEILCELLEDEASELREQARELFAEHNSNLRSVLRDLYDRYAAKGAGSRR